MVHGPFTIFAPTDEAFARIPSNTLASLASDLKTLTSVLKYHVIQDYILTPLVNGVRNETTLEGEIISIQRTPSGLLINGVAHTLPSQSDLVVNNGVIQSIDTVLFHISHPATETLTQIIVREDHRFKDLAVAFLLVNLLTTLSSGDYTVFAPVDSAFVKYKDNLLSFDAPNAPTIYTKVMQYHIVRGGRTASQLYNGQSLTTMEGMPLHVSKDASGMKINNVSVIEADIRATNGVLHVINDILLPPDFRG
ncbi:hypothetical protein CHS0354_040062 [Potamilus streckersoni]|uniref:FAS1 domain-containing protein n=1 Tax=Potamilus streckersoni TaxID=2493646 RepID=A0AAE0STD8_9BIVA|nr:hypothetical protein CHS0354_040062 [Potamilus streckersoni]